MIPDLFEGKNAGPPKFDGIKQYIYTTVCLPVNFPFSHKFSLWSCQPTAPGSRVTLNSWWPLWDHCKAEELSACFITKLLRLLPKLVTEIGWWTWWPWNTLDLGDIWARLKTLVVEICVKKTRQAPVHKDRAWSDCSWLFIPLLNCSQGCGQNYASWDYAWLCEVNERACRFNEKLYPRVIVLIIISHTYCCCH